MWKSQDPQLQGRSAAHVLGPPHLEVGSELHRNSGNSLPLTGTHRGVSGDETEALGLAVKATGML